jgi:hypothetical protein
MSEGFQIEDLVSGLGFSVFGNRSADDTPNRDGEDQDQSEI